MVDLIDVTDDFPWGLHDAVLCSVRRDLDAAEVQIDVLLMMNKRQTAGRLGRLTVSGVLFCSLDPPGGIADLDSERQHDPVTIDGGRVAELSDLPKLPDAPDGYWINWIYMMNRDAYLFVCARNASFGWLEDSERMLEGGVFFPGEEIPDHS